MRKSIFSLCKFLIPALALVLLIAQTSWPHGGGLDGHGCHHNRKAGGYHCHRGPMAGQYFSSQAEMLEKLRQQEKPKTQPKPKPSSSSLIPADSTRQCVRVVDGDTVELDGGEKVRLIGVNTPESVHPNRPVEHFGKEASAFTRRMAEGKSVRLVFDQANSATNHKDKYRRLLAYVYLPDDTLLNAEIIKQGYGFAYTRYPFALAEEFRAFEREARAGRKGLWVDP